QSLLLLLDDLQWADTATLDLLCHILRHRPATRLLIVGAYREGEVADNPAFQRAIAELNRLRVLTAMALGPLEADDIAALATDRLGAPITLPVGQMLFRQSEGNPFFAEELLRDWVETGALARPEWSWALAAPDSAILPSSIVGAVRQRLTRLVPEVV